MTERLPSADEIVWLEEVARTTEKSGQHLVATRFRKIAKALEGAEIMNTLMLKEFDGNLEVVKAAQCFDMTPLSAAQKAGEALRNLEAFQVVYRGYRKEFNGVKKTNA